MHRLLLRTLAPLVVLTLFSTQRAAAEGMDARAEELRVRAEEAYFEMEMEEALGTVDQALSLCVMGCSDEKRAALMIMRGMIVFIAKSDEAKARSHFEDALALDPDARLDRMLTNPDLERIFAQMKARALDPYAAPLPGEADDATADGETEAGPAAEDAEGAGRRRGRGRPFRRVFIEAGYSVTGATVHSGMRADRPPSVGASGDPQADSNLENDAYILSGTHGCGAPPGGYCVRANRGLLALTHGLHAGLGVYLSERVAVSARVRWSPDAGRGLLSDLLVGVRAHVRLTEPKREGFDATFFGGVMVGQIQLQPDQRPTLEGGDIERPWVRTGMGGLEIGTKLAVHLTPAFGFFVSPELYAMVPDFSLGAQVTGGIDIALGDVDPE